MKKILTLCIAAMTAVTMFAQSGHFEVGAVAGGLNGASAKYWLTNDFALQADLAVGLTRPATGYKDPFENKWVVVDFGMWDFTVNPNALYHFQLPANIKLYAGGGMNIGMMGGFNGGGVLGKFGLNTIVGATYDFDNIPLVLGFDFRPGWGMGFDKDNISHFFDWKIAASVRYRF